MIDGCFADIRYPSGYYQGAPNSRSKATTKWEDRKPVVYWRGRTSGGHAINGNFERFHRERAIQMFRNSSLFDIAFTGAIQCEKKDCDKIKENYRFDKSVALEENFKHKYLLDMVPFLMTIKKDIP